MASSEERRIVVGVDGSESSVRALTWAARQAELTGAVLEVVTTWEWPTSYGWGVVIPEGWSPTEDAQKVLDGVACGGVSGTRRVRRHDARIGQ
jgi:Universal stress protein family